MEKLQTSSLLVMVTIGCFLLQTSNALIHIVGGSFGWEIPPNNTFYSEWAAPRVFGLGDELVFGYSPEGHNVKEVWKEDYKTCGHEKVLKQWDQIQGPTVLTLITTGDRFFYSSVGTHCEMGQKLHIVVVGKRGSDGLNWAARVPPQRGIVPNRKMMSTSELVLLWS